ncbi:MAG: LuxA [Rhodospirillales bacterium 20-64-7]|nr:MAG: LuxA [Rhodospirillales bacterium 20-64-7]
MKFGVFYEHQLPRPWTQNSEYELFQNSLAQVELADRLGYDYIWEVEHHFLEEYSHSASPEVFLAAASQRTKQIRLGHGIVQLTTNQPHRVAERVATLDLISGGRVELGLGEGAGPAELHPFGVRVRDKRERWEEAVQAIIPMFTLTSWEFHGKYHDFPARNVVPKPYQKPHPPQAWVHRYYNMYLHHPRRLSEYKTNPNVAIVNGFMCAPTDEEALEKASGWTFFIFALSYYGRKGVDAPGQGDLWREYQNWRHTDKAQAALRNGLIGSPDTIRKRLRQFEDAHVDQVILLNQAGKTTHQDICESLDLFAREVMPEFHDRQPAQDAWKRDVLDGRIILEDLDTEAYDLYAHQNEDIVRLTPEQLKQRMAAKERMAAGN